MIPIYLKGPLVTVFLSDPRKRTAVTLHASADGEVEVFWGHKGRDHHLEKRQLVDAADSQHFYEQLLVQLGYEVPRVKLREHKKRRLRVRRSEHLVAGRRHTQYDLTCRVGDLYVAVSRGELVPNAIHASFGPKRALELCRALAEPLGWELTE